MNRVIKAVGLATSVFIYHTIQTSKQRKNINRAYEFGVSDGLVLARDFELVKSRQIEKDMIATKYGRYAKVVE